MQFQQRAVRAKDRDIGREEQVACLAAQSLAGRQLRLVKNPKLSGVDEKLILKVIDPLFELADVFLQNGHALREGRSGFAGFSTRFTSKFVKLLHVVKRQIEESHFLVQSGETVMRRLDVRLEEERLVEGRGCLNPANLGQHGQD